MVLSRGGKSQRQTAHWLALLAVLSQIILVVLCECGLPSRSGEASSDVGAHSHHTTHAVPVAGAHHHGGSDSEDDCNACRVTCGSTALFVALFILLALALIPDRRERSVREPIWGQNYSGGLFDGRAPPLSV